MIHWRTILFGFFLMVVSTGCQLAIATPAPGESAPAETDAAETRTIVDAQARSVAVPVAPQRVVVLSEPDLDSALALDVIPVGTVNGRGQTAPPAYLVEETAEIPAVGSFNAPSLEAIAALEPDLILIGGVFPGIADLPDQLTAIAPTVITFALGDDWQSAFLGTADALNRTAEAEAWLADYGDQVAVAQAAFGDDAGATVSIVRWNPDGPVIMAGNSFASRVVQDLGLMRPPSHLAIEGQGHSPTLSLELLEEIEADWLFVGTLNPDGAEAMGAAEANSLYQQLDVVQANRAVAVDGTVWTSLGGPLAALEVVEDVRAALADG